MTARAVALGLAGAALACLALLVYVVTVDHGYLKPEVERRLSTLIGRQVAIDGDMHLTVRRNLRLSVTGLRIVSGGDWTEKPDLLHVRSLAATVDTLRLMRGTLEILDLAVDGTLICLEKHPDGRVNWRFERPSGGEPGAVEDPGRVPLILHEARFTRTRAVLKTPDLAQKLYVTVDSLTQAIDEAGVVTTALAGNVNGTPLEATARLDDLASVLAGHRMSARVGGRLGEIRLEGDVAIDDLAAPSRPRLDVTLEGPDFAYLAGILKLPTRPTGALRATAHLAPEGGGMAFRADAEIGHFTLAARGSVDDLRSPTVIDADLEARGQNAAAVAGVLGIGHVPAAPFTLAGHVVTRRDAIEIDSLRATLAGHELEGGGVLLPGEVLTVDADVTLRGQDAAALAALAGVANVPARPYTVAGRVTTFAGGARFADLEATLGPDVLSGSGELRYAPLSVTATARARGPDAEALASAFGAAPVPAAPYDVQGRLDYRDGALDFEDLALALGDDGGADMHLAGNGELRFAPLAVDAHLDAGGASAAAVGSWFGFEPLPAEAWSVNGRVAYAGKRLRFEDVALRLGSAQASGGGTLRFAPLAATARVRAEGPDAAAAAAWFAQAGTDKAGGDRQAPDRTDWNRHVPDDAWTVRGEFEWDAGRLRFPDLAATVGALRLAGSGSLRFGEALGEAPALDARLTVEGPSAADLAQHFGVGWLPAAPYAAAARVATEADALRFDDLELRVGGNALMGHGRYRAGRVPSVEAGLAADELDLTGYTGKEAAPAESRARQDSRRIPDIALPLDALAALDARIDLRIARLVTAKRRLTDVRLTGSTEAGRLAVDRLELGSPAGGRLAAALRVEPRGEGADVRLELTGSRLELGLPARTEAERKALPRYDVSAGVAAHGRTLRELAASASGYAKMRSGPGRLRPAGTRFFTSDFLSQLLQTVNPFVRQDPYTEVECAVLFLRADDGRLRADPGLVLRTTRLDVLAQANVNLATEALEADISTAPRKGLGVSLSNVVNPYIQVRGTLLTPHLAIDKQATVVEGGAAIATGGLSILAKGLFGRLTASENPCSAAEQHAAPVYDALARQYGGVLSAAQ